MAGIGVDRHLNALGAADWCRFCFCPRRAVILFAIRAGSKRTARVRRQVSGATTRSSPQSSASSILDDRGYAVTSRTLTQSRPAHPDTYANLRAPGLDATGRYVAFWSPRGGSVPSEHSQPPRTLARYGRPDRLPCTQRSTASRSEGHACRRRNSRRQWQQSQLSRTHEADPRRHSPACLQIR